MDFINFPNDSLVTEKTFSDIEANFSKHLNSFYMSRYGLVKGGFNIKLENNRVTVSRGLGVFPNGKPIYLKSELSNNFYGKNGYLYLKDGSSALGVLEEDSIPENPYSNTYFSTDNILAIALIENGKIYRMNYTLQIPNIPINGVALYRGEFRDYITLRGCKKYKEMLDTFLFFSKETKKTGGNNSIKLTKDHIPSLTIRGETEKGGRHRHEIPDGVNKGDGGSGESGAGSWVGRDKTSTKPGQGSQSHNHDVAIKHENPNQEEFSLEPSYTTFLPIVREF